MKFPKEAVRACDELAAKYPDLANSSNDHDRRKLTRMIAEQVASARGARWGCKKRAGLSDDMQSKDSIAYRESDETTSVWDWQNGTTRKRSVNEGAEPSHGHLPYSEARFMVVTPTDHLGWEGAQEPQQPEPTPITPQPLPAFGGLAELASFIQDVRGSLGEIHKKIDALSDVSAKPPAPVTPPEGSFPTYETKVPFIGVVYSVPKTD